jgi:hypothetical protein
VTFRTQATAITHDIKAAPAGAADYTAPGGARLSLSPAAARRGGNSGGGGRIPWTLELSCQA